MACWATTNNGRQTTVSRPIRQVNLWNVGVEGRRPCCLAAVEFRPALPTPDRWLSPHPAFQPTMFGSSLPGSMMHLQVTLFTECPRLVALVSIGGHFGKRCPFGFHPVWMMDW